MEPIFETEGTCLRILLPGEVDHPVSDKIRRESDRIMGKLYIKTIVFDFSRTTFMDSSGIGLIMGRYRALGMRGDCIRAIHVSSHIDKLLHLSGVHKFMEIRTDAEIIGE
ncbi:MAG: anti-sigma factor antagonist [Eubacteriales bacterium]|nr:anti-sigma factor antagonist [Eubacteriales bacterium]